MKSSLDLSHWLLLLIILSCSTPHKIAVIESKDKENISWSYGREIQTIESAENTARINFEESTKDELVFYVSIDHRGEDTLLFSPLNVVLTTPDGNKIRDIDPESKILAYRRQISRNESKAKNLQLLQETALAVSSTSTSSNIEMYPSNQIYGLTPKKSINMDLDFWKNIALRKTTLAKGYEIVGMVVFPRNNKIREFSLIVPIGNETVEATFKQRLFRP